MAQTDIQFSILKAEADGMSASVTNALDLKLRQVFDRNGAGAADLYNVFAIEPTISVEKIISTKDGVVLDVPIAQGELVLIAKNIIDGAEYYSTSIELEGESLGSKDKAMKSMFSLPSATIMFSPQMSLRTNPFFIFIFLGFLLLL